MRLQSRPPGSPRNRKDPAKKRKITQISRRRKRKSPGSTTSAMQAGLSLLDLDLLTLDVHTRMTWAELSSGDGADEDEVKNEDEPHA